jgi:hypothetical protein
MLREVKEKGWNVILTIIGKLGINTLRSALEKRLPDGSPEEEIVTVTAPYFIETIDAMGDDVPNKQQIPAIWLRYLQLFMIPFLFRLFRPVIDRINQDYNREMVQYLADSTEKIGLLLTDEIKPDNEQIEQFVTTERADPKLEILVIDKFIGGNLNAAKADPTLSLFILGALKSLWRSFVKPDEANNLRSVSAVDGTKTFVIDGYEVTIKKIETI